MRIYPALAVLLGLALCSSGDVVAQSKVKLRFGVATAITGPGGVASLKFAEVAKEATNGAIEIEVFPNSQLGGELEMLAQIRAGTLDAALIGSGVTAAIEPTFVVTELPYIWKSRESVWKVLNGAVGQKILATLEPKGIKALGWGAWGYRGIISTGFAIAKPADLKGRRIRVVENPVYVQTIRALGGSPVPVAWPEVYTGLQQKTFDGVDTSYFAFLDAKLHEVADNLAITDHIYTATLFLINLKTFNALSPEQKAALQKAAAAAGALMGQSVDKINDDAIATMQARGVKVTRPDRDALATLVAPVHEAFAPIVGRELLSEVKAAQ
jgi:tripartite ATP-independent transporter DctP family solute receptor